MGATHPANQINNNCSSSTQNQIGWGQDPLLSSPCMNKYSDTDSTTPRPLHGNFASDADTCPVLCQTLNCLFRVANSLSGTRVSSVLSLRWQLRLKTCCHFHFSATINYFFSLSSIEIN